MKAPLLIDGEIFQSRPIGVSHHHRTHPPAKQKGRASSIEREIFPPKKRKGHPLQAVVMVRDRAKFLVGILGIEIIGSFRKCQSHPRLIDDRVEQEVERKGDIFPWHDPVISHIDFASL